MDFKRSPQTIIFWFDSGKKGAKNWAKFDHPNFEQFFEYVQKSPFKSFDTVEYAGLATSPLFKTRYC